GPIPTGTVSQLNHVGAARKVFTRPGCRPRRGHPCHGGRQPNPLVVSRQFVAKSTLACSPLFRAGVISTDVRRVQTPLLADAVDPEAAAPDAQIYRGQVG